MRYVIGIDEAGRGPLAGPVAVGAVIIARDFNWKLVAGARDSKQMTPTARNDIFAKMRNLQNEGLLDFAVAFSSAVEIDRRGIVPSIQSALNRALAKITEDGPLYEILLDGNLRASRHFQNQKTIIGGDDLEPVISLASIVAKVSRDRLMIRLAKRYPAYGFDVHKGYGTLAHRRAIASEGLSAVHRSTFCTRILPKPCP